MLSESKPWANTGGRRGYSAIVLVTLLGLPLTELMSSDVGFHRLLFLLVSVTFCAYCVLVSRPKLSVFSLVLFALLAATAVLSSINSFQLIWASIFFLQACAAWLLVSRIESRKLFSSAFSVALIATTYGVFVFWGREYSLHIERSLFVHASTNSYFGYVSSLLVLAVAVRSRSLAQKTRSTDLLLAAIALTNLAFAIAWNARAATLVLTLVLAQLALANTRISIGKNKRSEMSGAIFCSNLLVAGSIAILALATQYLTNDPRYHFALSQGISGFLFGGQPTFYDGFEIHNPHSTLLFLIKSFGFLGLLLFLYVGALTIGYCGIALGTAAIFLSMVETAIASPYFYPLFLVFYLSVCKQRIKWRSGQSDRKKYKNKNRIKDIYFRKKKDAMG